ncbi:hypothetical protein RI367_005029 [Sorochytrium milnesiophthora]
MPSSVTTLLALALLSNAVLSLRFDPAHPLRPLDLNTTPECQQVVQTWQSGNCATAMKMGNQQTAADSTPVNGTLTSDAIQKSIDDQTKTLQQYCNDKCQSDYTDYYNGLVNKCGVSDPLQLSLVLAPHGLMCATDKTTKNNCAIDNLNMEKPVLMQNTTLAAQALQPTTGAGSANDTSADPLALNYALLSLPKETLCTPCYQFQQQQSLLFIKRVVAIAGSQSDQLKQTMAQEQDFIGKLNAKCGDNWVTTDDSRYALNSPAAPTTGGNSTGQADSSSNNSNSSNNNGTNSTTTTGSNSGKNNGAGQVAAPILFTAILSIVLFSL